MLYLDVIIYAAPIGKFLMGFEIDISIQPLLNKHVWHFSPIIVYLAVYLEENLKVRWR